MQKTPNKQSLHNAFTLMELLFVIVIVSILTVVIIPRTTSDRLHEAATQLVSHIRYTQHLAMMDDKFDVNDIGAATGKPEWHKSMWQIRFTKGSGGSDGKIAYAVFSDWKGLHTSSPQKEELAKDPLTGYGITGGVTNTIHYKDEGIYSKANIGVTYGINDIDFSDTCDNSMRISFDHLGRPNNTHLTNADTNIEAMEYLIVDTCIISLCLTDDCDTASINDKIEIAIEAETGYTHIL